MQPREMRIAHRIRDMRHRLLDTHLVRALVLSVASERAELTVRETDIREVHMAVHVVVDNITALLLPHAVSKRTNPRNIAARKEPQPILPCQPFTILYFLLNIQVFAVQFIVS